MEERVDWKYISELAQKKLSGSISAAEERLLEEWYAHAQQNEADAQQAVAANRDAFAAEIFNRIEVTIHHKHTIRKVSRMWAVKLAAAALLLVACGAVLWAYFSKDNTVALPALAFVQSPDAAPGSDKAVLKLADGESINLTDAANGQLSKEAGLRFQKAAGGQLLIQVMAAANDKGAAGISSIAVTTPRYHTIKTPYGGQYQVVLEDGTRVLLNAGSMLSFPQRFAARERKVLLEGEAYFEVAANKNAPFTVVTPHQEVEVLGTQFNISAYADELETNTTLEKGSIKVIAGQGSNAIGKILTPGQQAVTRKAGELAVQQAELTSNLAWVHGMISFKEAGIPAIMRQVARWYNVRIRYEGQVPADTFTGGIARTAPLSSLLQVLSLNQIKFRMENGPEGKTLIVLSH